MRALSQHELRQVRTLSEKAINFALIEPTETGLKKSILDATGPVRTFLASEKLHSFEQQRQGQQYKRKIDACLVSDEVRIDSIASLYRPPTKKGDPRIWFTNLRSFCKPNDIIAILVADGVLCLINLTRSNLAESIAHRFGPIAELIQGISAASSAVSNQLLQRLRQIARAGPIESVMPEYADTAVGRTIEHALGIKMNSRSEPDYQGIEIKSSRIRKSANKHTLFAKVPDWDISHLKSTSEILDNFGYETERDFRLYCTVSSRLPNPQSLYLKLDRSLGVLEERSSMDHRRKVAAWRLDTLRKTLAEKHAETFWISVVAERQDGKEWFQIQSVEHTKAPIMAQFELLLELGDITVDHLIKRNRVGRVTEGGPLFKVGRKAFPLLFPPSQKYALI